MNLDVFKHFTQREVKAGEIIFQEKEPGDVMYIILSGRVAILKQVMEGIHKTLGVLGAGEYFGEMSLLLKADRSATARAIDDTVLAEVKRDQFKEILQKHLDVGVNLLIQLAHRLEKANEEAILLALELELTKRKPELYPPIGGSKRPIIVASGNFEVKYLSEVLRLRKNLQWDDETYVIACLMQPGQAHKGLLYIFETDDMREVIKLISCFKNLVNWDISLAVPTDEPLLDEKADEAEHLTS